MPGKSAIAENCGLCGLLAQDAGINCLFLLDGAAPNATGNTRQFDEQNRAITTRD
jgi:hypothetical protein